MASLAQLETDAKHVDYEISMFMELSDRLLRQRDIPADDVLRRAVFESCLLHFRALLEFFRTDTKYGDDLRATDYIDDPAHKTAITACGLDSASMFLVPEGTASVMMRDGVVQSVGFNVRVLNPWNDRPRPATIGFILFATKSGDFAISDFGLGASYLRKNAENH